MNSGAMGQASIWPLVEMVMDSVPDWQGRPLPPCSMRVMIPRKGMMFCILFCLSEWVNCVMSFCMPGLYEVSAHVWNCFSVHCVLQTTSSCQ